MVRNILIFAVGLLACGGYGIPGLVWLAGAVVLSYGAALLTRKWSWAAWVSVGVNALLLTLLRLQTVTGMTLLAPLGVSYFTLQLISYNVDVYRGKYEPERNLFRFALYVTYIPHLFIGPIERWDTMKTALFGPCCWSWDDVFAGGARALWGLTKKLVIAARAGVIIGAVSADPEVYRGGYALLAMVLYSVQLYADFSGGMDMVLGLSRMLGIRLTENFDAPYFSQSFQEFWRRWHITLGSWLREYVYIPLGGNRKGKVRKVINLILTFLVSGLWHGLEYLLWGLFNGIFVAFGTRLQTRWKLLNQAGTFALVSLLWCFFVWPDARTAMELAASVFTTFNYADVAAQIGSMGLALGDWIVFGVAVLALWGYDWKRQTVAQRFAALCPAAKTAVICTLALVVLVFGMYGIGFNAEAFIYSRF